MGAFVATVGAAPVGASVATVGAALVGTSVAVVGAALVGASVAVVVGEEVGVSVTAVIVGAAVGAAGSSMKQTFPSTDTETSVSKWSPVMVMMVPPSVPQPAVVLSFVVGQPDTE